MATAIGVPTDNKVLQMLLTHLIRDKPTNMGASTEKIYGLVKDHAGNLRIPLGIAKMIWQALPIKKLHELPRKHIPNTIALGEDGRDYQIPTYETLVQHMINTHMAYLSLYCGAGKTIIASKLICEMGVVTGVVTDSIVIFPQWIEVFKKRTGAVVVGIDKPVDKLPPADVYIFMVSACSKMHPSVLAHIQLLVVDEALYFMTPTRIPALLNFTPSYSLGLCAEIKRDDGMHCYLPYFFGPQMIRRISTKPFTVYRVETPYKPEIQFARYTGRPDWNLVLESLAENQDRNEDIIYLCRSLTDSKIIIGCKRKEQARYLHSRLVELGESAALLIEKSKTIPQCRILVGIYAKMGKGVDVKNLCPEWEGEVFDAAILAADMCNPEQFVGRVFRTKMTPTIYHFVDDYPTLRKHFDKDCQPWYLSRNAVIHRTVINRPK